MSVATQPLTYDDLCKAREDGNRYELIEGELVLVAAPPLWHQWLSGQLFGTFRDAVTLTGAGFVFTAPLDVRLPNGSVVQPDLVVVLNDRAQILTEPLIDGAPSLLVEISSRSSRATDRKRKRNLYARLGVAEYWWVDPPRRTIVVQANPVAGAYQTIRRETATARSITVPNVEVDLIELFRPVLPWQ
jgi:Uma2 family endonuclease